MAEVIEACPDVYDVDQQMCTTGQAARRQVVSQQDCTYVLHGTWATEAQWWRRAGGFSRALDAVHPGVWRCQNVQVAEQPWSGDNTHTARDEGGRQLARHIQRLEQRRHNGELAYRNINLVAHSHGGNVVLSALKRLAQTDVRVHHVVLIATPQVRIQYGDWGGPSAGVPSSQDAALDAGTAFSGRQNYREEWFYFVPDVFQAVTGTFYNIYSPEDGVQTDGATLLDGINAEQVPDSEHFAGARSGRTYFGPDSHRVTNIQQNTRVGSTDAHSVLHSNRMGQAVGHLLAGRSWSAARRRAGVPSTITNDDDMGE
ncbi:MAG: esterase/lipase family protein [Gemmatimonadales bacterium]